MSNFNFRFNFNDLRLTVVVPMLNEEKAITPLLMRLTQQSDSDFSVVFVDNGSTDNTKQVITDYMHTAEQTDNWVIVDEPQKGTGAAADTGVKEAISRGATHIARTDADCLPGYNWVQVIKEQFILNELHLISGKVTARTDDIEINPLQVFIFNKLISLAGVFGKLRLSNKGKQYQGPYVMVAGCNVAFTAEIYTRSGGFPRTKIEDVHEDRALINNVRRHTSAYKYIPTVIVSMSARRVVEWGIINTLKWYKDHSYKPAEVDIR